MSATIALVDDDRNILTSVSMVLEGEGYTVKTYNDGATALNAFEKSLPDLAVLDVKMPRMDGMELLRRLRETSSRSSARSPAISVCRRASYPSM